MDRNRDFRSGFIIIILGNLGREEDGRAAQQLLSCQHMPRTQRQKNWNKAASSSSIDAASDSEFGLRFGGCWEEERMREGGALCFHSVGTRSREGNLYLDSIAAVKVSKQKRKHQCSTLSSKLGHIFVLLSTRTQKSFVSAYYLTKAHKESKFV